MPASGRPSALFPRIDAQAIVATPRSCACSLSQLRLCSRGNGAAGWLALQLWKELGLDGFWAERLAPSRKGTRWDQVLVVLVAYRLIAPGSEWRLHRQWFERSAMGDLLGADAALADPHKLYACHDRLLRPQGGPVLASDRRVGGICSTPSFDVLLYDLTSTYFECDPPDDEKDKRRYGYVARPAADCVQVVIALIVTPEGFPLAYEVLSGNTGQQRRCAASSTHRDTVRQGPRGSG